MPHQEDRLTKQVKQGSREAQKALYDLYAHRLYSIIVRYTHRGDIAEDLLHDTFIKIFQKIGTFTYRGEGSLRAWIERIAINTTLEWLRNNKKLETTPLDPLIENQTIIEEPPSYSDTTKIPKEILIQLINELPDGYRVVFNMFCIDGYSHKQIAAELGINHKSSSSQLLRAKKLLASKINQYIKSPNKK